MTRRKVGSVRQRKDGTWESRLTVNGKRRSVLAPFQPNGRSGPCEPGGAR